MEHILCSAHEVADLAAAVTGQGRSLRLVVRGSSMSPTLRTGDRVTVAPQDPARLNPGDIVLIGGAQPRIHRVVWIDRRAQRVVTRGDSLAGEDPPASFDDVLGRVVWAERSLAGWSRWFLGRCRQVVSRARGR